MAARHRRCPGRHPLRRGTAPGALQRALIQRLPPATDKATVANVPPDRRSQPCNWENSASGISGDHAGKHGRGEPRKRIEGLGYCALWIPETVGRNPFVHAAWLLANTQKLIVATGIAQHLSPRTRRDDGRAENARGTVRTTASCSASAYRTSRWSKACAASSTAHPVADHAQLSGRRWLRRPTRRCRRRSRRRVSSPRSARRCSKLARDTCTGAHPYFTSPDHTAMAREMLGPEQVAVRRTEGDSRDRPGQGTRRSRGRSPRSTSACRTTATTGCGWA